MLWLLKILALSNLWACFWKWRLWTQAFPLEDWAVTTIFPNTIIGKQFGISTIVICYFVNNYFLLFYVKFTFCFKYAFYGWKNICSSNSVPCHFGFSNPGGWSKLSFFVKKLQTPTKNICLPLIYSYCACAGIFIQAICFFVLFLYRY